MFFTLFSLRISSGINTTGDDSFMLYFFLRNYICKKRRF
nr:MAG TPA: hypothetical protein [Caudoviricetes sp.]